MMWEKRRKPTYPPSGSKKPLPPPAPPKRRDPYLVKCEEISELKKRIAELEAEVKRLKKYDATKEDLISANELLECRDERIAELEAETLEQRTLLSNKAEAVVDYHDKWKQAERERDALQKELRQERLLARAATLAKTMQCNCDLDAWEPEASTGHSHVCRIHKAAIEAKGGA